MADRQDSYGAGGGNMALEIRALLQEQGSTCRVMSRVYGLGGRDFYLEDAKTLFALCEKEGSPEFDYFGG